MITHKANKGLVKIILIFIIAIGLVISIPILIFSTALLPYAKIDKNVNFFYKSSEISEIKILNLNVDVGNIEISYVYPPVDFDVMVKINFEIVGSNLSGKSYLDYFDIGWENTTSSLNLTLKLKSDSWFDSSIWIKQNITTIIKINANLLLDINCVINRIGGVEFYVPMGVHTSNMVMNVNEGNILIDFRYCIIEGNITAEIHEGGGDLIFKSYNVQYPEYNYWYFYNNIGIITLDIFQSLIIGSNISGIVKTHTGRIELNYDDYLPNIGAKFSLYNFSGTFDPNVNSWENFDLDYMVGQPGYVFTSTDYPVLNNFNLSLYKDLREGTYRVNLFNK